MAAHQPFLGGQPAAQEASVAAAPELTRELTFRNLAQNHPAGSEADTNAAEVVDAG